MQSGERTLLSSLRISGSIPRQRLASMLRDADHRELARHAVDEGVAGLLYRDLRRTELAGDVEAEAFDLLRDSYLCTAADNTRRRAALVELVAHPDMRGAHVIALKGMALIDDLYGDPGLRPMGDIDVWGNDGDVARMHAALRRLGYAEQPFYPDTLRRGAVTFDIHRSLLGSERIVTRAGILAGAEADAYAAAGAFSIDGGDLLRLDARDAAMLACLHTLKHNAARLLWLLEAEALLAGLQAQQLDALLALATTRGQRRALGIAARLIADLPAPSGARAPQPGANVERLLRETASPALSRLERRALRQRRRRGRLPAWAPLLFFSAQRTRREQLASAWETFFPRPAVLRQIFEDRDAWLATLYLRRVGQLVERLVRH